MLSEFCPFSGKGVMTDNIITNRTTDMIFFLLNRAKWTRGHVLIVMDIAQLLYTGAINILTSCRGDDCGDEV